MLVTISEFYSNNLSIKNSMFPFKAAPYYLKEIQKNTFFRFVPVASIVSCNYISYQMQVTTETYRSVKSDWIFSKRDISVPKL